MRKYKSYKIHWYKFIPFVIAEIINPEWEKVKSLIEKKKLTELPKIYNKNGNWHILEGLDYFWLKKEWWTNKNKDILFNDSMFLRFNGKTDKEKYQMLVDTAKEDIDFIWSKLLKTK